MRAAAPLGIPSVPIVPADPDCRQHTSRGINHRLYASRQVGFFLGLGQAGWSLYSYILVIVAFFLVFIQIARIIGPRILGNMLIGRYHHPNEEHRTFLFIDLVDSTALARQLGDLGVQRLLTRFFFDLGQPVAENGGEIHAYIGDEAIIS